MSHYSLIQNVLFVDSKNNSAAPRDCAAKITDKNSEVSTPLKGIIPYKSRKIVHFKRVIISYCWRWSEKIDSFESILFKSIGFEEEKLKKWKKVLTMQASWLHLFLCQMERGRIPVRTIVFPTLVPLQLFTKRALPHGLCVGTLGGVEVCVFSRSWSLLKRDDIFHYKQQHVDGAVTMQVKICIKRKTSGQDMMILNFMKSFLADFVLLTK